MYVTAAGHAWLVRRESQVPDLVAQIEALRALKVDG
jgi:hypothetical protein